MPNARHILLRFFILVALALPMFAGAATAKRPNILFILVDDQSPFDLKCHNPYSPLATPPPEGPLSGQGKAKKRTP